jgi:Cytochrome P450
MDPLLIRDTLITLLFASRDNTQNSFTWAIYELSKHPEWMDRMRAEAIALAPRTGDVVSYANINVNISFLPKVIFLSLIPRRTLSTWPFFMRHCGSGLVSLRMLD